MDVVDGANGTYRGKIVIDGKIMIKVNNRCYGVHWINLALGGDGEKYGRRKLL